MRKIIRSFIFLILINILFFSCTTTGAVGDFYDEWESVDLISSECKLAENEEPKVFYSSDIASDIYYLRSNYYYIVGHSSWNGPAKGDDLKKETVSKCKELGAKIALYTWNYTDTRNGTYSVPHTNYHSYTDSNGYIRSYTTTTYSTNSYSINRYDYDVYFFVPHESWFMAMPKLGVVVRDLDSDDRMNLHRNTGVYVGIVYENSPAFYVNLTKGDIITEINGKNILNSEDYYATAKNEKSGDVLHIVYFRNGEEHQVDVPIF